ncbi:MAG TPA: RNA 2',3'-cyclic phosphodiesterase [Solirubrobacteraceae bacterium]
MGEGRTGDERARLFVALELPEEARDTLVRWRSSVLNGVAGLRALPDDHLHVTLCFLGWCSTSHIDAIADACQGVSPLDPPTVDLGQARWLPPRRPRVLAVELEDARGRLVAIQARLSGLLQAGGWYEPESRPYLPHVTVARAGRRDRVKPAALSAPPPLSFAASRVTLFRSRLSPGGARYEALSGVSLISTA